MEIRIGNDIKIAWSIFKDGQIFDLEGADVKLYLKDKFGSRKEVSDFTRRGNLLSFVFYGKDQKSTGEYTLTLVINEGEDGMLTTDACDFVKLVSCSCKKADNDQDSNIRVESISLTSDVTVGLTDDSAAILSSYVIEQRRDGHRDPDIDVSHGEFYVVSPIDLSGKKIELMRYITGRTRIDKETKNYRITRKWNSVVSISSSPRHNMGENYRIPTWTISLWKVSEPTPRNPLFYHSVYIDILDRPMFLSDLADSHLGYIMFSRYKEEDDIIIYKWGKTRKRLRSQSKLSFKFGFRIDGKAIIPFTVTVTRIGMRTRCTIQ